MRIRSTSLASLVAVLALTLGAATASAHTASASVTCTSATINWTAFDSSGSGNGGMNSPTWKITFTGAGGGTQVQQGQVNFSGSSYSINKSLPGINGTAVIQSAWTSSQTRDGYASSYSQTFNLTSCKTAKLKLDKKVSVGNPSGTYADSGLGHVGDTAYYAITASNTGTTDLSVTTTDFSKSCGSGTLYTTPESTTAVAMPQTIAAGSSATYYCKHVLTSADASASGSNYVNKACTSGMYQGTFPAQGDSTSAALCDTATVHVLTPAIKVAESTPDTVAHVGDTVHYTIDITNTGNTPLTVTPADTGCDSLDTTAFNLAAGGVKTLNCTHTVTSGDTSPLVNQACANGMDQIGGQVSDCAHVSTTIVHPALQVSKTVDKTTASTGDTLTYTITATNTGDTVLHLSNFTDHVKGTTTAGCDFASGATPPSRFDLNPGQSAAFTCTHTLAAGDPSPYTNVACFGATDSQGATPMTTTQCGEATTSVSAPQSPPAQGTAPATDNGGSTPPEQSGQQVLGERFTPGTARLSGQTGCVTSAFNARIRGTKLATVTFILDGKVVERVRVRPGQTNVALRINPARMHVGIHRLVATVTFQSGSGTRPRTLRLSFQRCAKRLSAPRFTG